MGKQLKSTQMRTEVPAKYSAFSEINGEHPLKERVPDSVLNYPVQQIPSGKVSYFNFRLAKEMGLIPAAHSHRVTKDLEEALLKTFSLRIINEYDQENGTKPLGPLKDNSYMATRYLQLQHKSRKGFTSGDGRSIWNGTFHSKGITWDLSSRGTGVTKLSPGSVEADKHLKTGSTEFGYGCGLAEIGELYSSAILSEIMHSRGFRTERMVCIIDLGKGLGIGVRAAENLLRPAHLFLYLKQGQLEPLEKSFAYLTDRQIDNQHWPKNSSNPNEFLKIITHEFAEFSGMLDFHCVFAWMDWDGDNLLAHAGIIDYGSIRQFGLRHEQYRYDDVDRFSTNLIEQKAKARQTVQTFAQMVDFLKSKRKKPLMQFRKHPCLKTFDKVFEETRLKEFLKILGVEDADTLRPSLRKKAYRALYALLAIEKVHTAYKQKKLPDGVHRPAIYNRRKLLHFWATRWSETNQPKWVTVHLHDASLADATRGKDRKLSYSKAAKFKKFTQCMDSFFRELTSTGSESARGEALESVLAYCEKPLATGNAIEEIVEIVLAKKRSRDHLQSLVDRVIWHFSGPKLKRFGPELSLAPSVAEDLQLCLNTAKEYEEDI